MSATTSVVRRSAAIKRGITVGVIGGLLGAALMAMYAMVVSATVKDVGFFTPLYHIASAFIDPTAMMTSIEDAAGGDATYFTAGPAVVGLVVHMMTGAVAGALFGALVALRPAPRWVVVLAGAAFGVVVMLVNNFIGLPLVADLFGGGDPIADMPSIVGWGTFTVEHLIYGLALGAVAAARLATTTVPSRRLATRSA